MSASFVSRTTVLTVATAACFACSGTPEASAPQSTATRSEKTSVPTAVAPESDCDWIPVADVEAIVGKLSGPPRREDGCRYALAMPDSVRALREKELRAFEAVGGMRDGAMKNYRDDPATYALTLSVEWSGGIDTVKLTNQALKKMFGEDAAASGSATPAAGRAKAPAGWDDEGGVPNGFTARTGHLRVTIQGEAPDVPREPMKVLAAKVRDRIADLPFPVKNPYQVPMDVPANAAPCGLLTRAEAEAVLGPLAVDPYRSSSYFPPLVHPAGNSCAYFTAGHHVFVLSPTWIGGAETFALEKGIGGLIGRVMPQETVVFQGPWDKSHVTASGSLDFLKDDRLLEVNFAFSSTNRVGALKLATQAMPRLSALTYEAKRVPTEVRPAPGAGGTAPGWSRILKLSDGRTMVSDGAFMLDAALVKPAALPKDDAAAGSIDKLLSAELPNEIAITQLAPGPRPHTYAGPGNVLFNADYIDYLRRTLPADRVRIRVGPGRPAVILLDGKPVGLIMPLA